MEKYLSWIHSGDLHKAHSEHSKTKYYIAFFEEWEMPVVMFPQNKQRGTLWVCTFNFSPCTNKTQGAQTHTAMHEHTETFSDLGARCIHEKATVIYCSSTRTHATHAWQTAS